LTIRLGQGAPRLRALRVEPQALAVLEDRLPKPAEVVEGPPSLAPRECVQRVEARGLAVGGERPLEVSGGVQREAQSPVRARRVRGTSEGLLHVLARLLQAIES